MHTGMVMMVVGTLAAAAPDTLGPRVAQVNALPDVPRSGEVPADMVVILVQPSRITVAPSASADAVTTDEAVPGGPAGSAKKRLDGGMLGARLAALARGGATRVAVLPEAGVTLDLLSAVFALARAQALEPVLAGGASFPLATVAATQLHACGDVTLPDCSETPDACDPPSCAELAYRVRSDGGVDVSAVRRLVDQRGVCAEDAAVPSQVTAPWDGMTLGTKAGACGTFARAPSRAELEALHVEVAGQLPVCASARVVADPSVTVAQLAPLLSHVTGLGAYAVAWSAENAGACQPVVPVAAMATRAVPVDFQVTRTTGALKAPAVLSAMRARRAEVARCVARARMLGTEVKGDMVVSARVNREGKLAGIKVERAGNDALAACIRDAVATAEPGPQARPAELVVTVTVGAR